MRFYSEAGMERTMKVKESDFASDIDVSRGGKQWRFWGSVLERRGVASGATRNTGRMDYMIGGGAR